MGRRILVYGAALLALILASYRTGFAQIAFERVLNFIALQGKPVPASPARLSEHEVQELSAMTPQQQAERLLERAINHYDGATELVQQPRGLLPASSVTPSAADDHTEAAV
jgi:hypothetical protein